MISDIEYDILVHIRDSENSSVSKADLVQIIQNAHAGRHCRKDLVEQNMILPLTPEGFIVAYELTQKGRAAIEERKLYFDSQKTMRKRFWITTSIAVVGAIRAFMPDILALWALLSQLLTR